ncbi:MAG TPA: hypothetical protein VND45_02640 [Thermoanaerobaculia bacterium]|nr:hypothetical protein [Thermoanaerobaculia bacterium]
MKKLLFSLLLLAVIVPAAEARVRFGVRAGLTDGEPMIGTEVVVPIAGDFVANPNIEFTSEMFSANADVHYDFGLANNVSFWVGAGLAFVNPDEGDFEGGVNLLGGVGIAKGRWYPYGQVRFTSTGDAGDFTSIAVGVRF